jgi:2-C-methyl-D-erythritol 4-phosphate cytidylyltransferase
MELAGTKIFLCQGSYENLKVTTPEDWILADKILQQRRLQNQNLKENGSG